MSSIVVHPLLAAVLLAAGGVALVACTANSTDPHATTDARSLPCVGCHRTAYSLTDRPAHANLFPTTCQTCHNTQAWIPGTVPASLHPKFTLDGLHVGVSCAKCHTAAPARYSGTPTTCSTCHASDFQIASAVISGHAMFPMTCGSCHTTAGWNPTINGMGSHPEAKFPITTGSHANHDVSCNDCHVSSRGSPIQGANCDCIHCHLGAHNEPAIDAIHLTVQGYTSAPGSAPNACLHCHPSG